MIPAQPTTGPGLPLGWIVAGASGISCERCHRALWLQPASYVLWPLEIRAFIVEHAKCAESVTLEEFNDRVKRTGAKLAVGGS